MLTFIHWYFVMNTYLGRADKLIFFMWRHDLSSGPECPCLSIPVEIYQCRHEAQPVTFVATTAPELSGCMKKLDQRQDPEFREFNL